MDDTKLNRLRSEIESAKKKREFWDEKIKDLEQKYNEAEKTCVHEMVKAFNMTPEQLSALIKALSGGNVPDPALLARILNREERQE